MAKCKKYRKKFDEINVIPFIDIMLVLLVMVLTTATFVKTGIIPVELPEAKKATKEKPKKELTIYIKSNGDMFVDKQKVDTAQLRSKLASIPKDQVVILRSDKNARFQNFVTVMDILKSLGHENLYIVTKE
ncbi:MAG: TonB system transport protein ExbD [Epsilonproteobacteria bacterium]|nr:TonB system transport protein ExbD [Campylobacterota bacterium]